MFRDLRDRLSIEIRETRIAVNGTGEVRVSADTAVISLGVNSRDKDVLKAQQKVNEFYRTWEKEE